MFDLSGPVRVLLVLLAPQFLTAQTRWTVYPSPLARIASTAEDGSPRMGGITWAVRVGPDELAVGDGVDNTVRILAFDGTERRRFGREGRGPGEFRTIGWLSTCGLDSLFVWDVRDARMSVLSPLEGYVRSWTNVALGGPMTSACSSEKTFAFRTRLRRSEATRPLANTATADGIRYRIYRDTFDIQMVDADGKETWEAAGQYRRESVSANLPDGGFTVMPRIGAPRTYVDFSGTTLVVADPDSAAIRLLDRGGRVVSRFSVAERGKRPSPRAHDAEIEALLASTPGIVVERWSRVARAIPRAEYRLAFYDLSVDPTGIIWLRVSAPGERETRLDGYRIDGTAVGTLTIPVDLALFEIGTAHVLGRLEDDEGEQHLVLYRFHRRY